MIGPSEIFLEHWACPNRSTSFDPQLQNRNKCAPLDFAFSVYIHGRWTLGKTIHDKAEVLLETYWGAYLGTLWELDGNTLRTRRKTKNPSLLSPPPSQKEKNWTVHECMLSLPIGCMNFFFPNLFVIIFRLG